MGFAESVYVELMNICAQSCFQHSLACMGTQLCPLSATPWTMQPTRFLCPQSFPGKNAREDCHCLLLEIFPTQELNPSLLGLLCCRCVHYHRAIWDVLPFISDLNNYSLPFLSNKTNFIDLVRGPIFIFTNSIVYFLVLNQHLIYIFILTFCLYFIIITLF